MEHFFQRVLNEGESTDGSDSNSNSNSNINVRDEGPNSQEQTAQYFQNNKGELKKFLQWRKMQKAMEKGHYPPAKPSIELVRVVSKQDNGGISNRME